MVVFLQTARGKFLMFFHAGGPGKERTVDNEWANCSIAVAWRDDLTIWHWPGAA